ERGVLRENSHLLLPRKNPLAVFVPSVVELAFVFVGPLFWNLMWRMHRAGAEIEEERFVGRELFGVGDELHGPVRQIFGQVIAFFRRLGRVDLVVVENEIGVILVRVAAEKSVIPLVASTQRPTVVRPGGAGLFGGRQMPLADSEGVV